MRRAGAPVALLLASMLIACAGERAHQKSGRADEAATTARPQPRPHLVVAVNTGADVLHLLEQASRWRQGMSRDYHRALDDLAGLAAEDQTLLRKFAFIRNELAERSRKQLAQPSFAEPFGPAGLFPPGPADLVERFWQTVIELPAGRHPGAALSDLLPSEDAALVEQALVRLARLHAEVAQRDPAWNEALVEFGKLLARPQLQQLLRRFAAFVGVAADKLELVVIPVWAPAESDLHAALYGRYLLVTVRAGERPGAEHALLAVHEAGRRLLAMLPSERKVRLSALYCERVGCVPGNFLLVEGLLDALAHGLAAGLLGLDTRQLAWPGSPGRRRLARAMVPLLQQALDGGARLDGRWVGRLAFLHERLLKPRPADFLYGAMVIGSDAAINVFRSQVIRWTVWKFPIGRRYNYRRKLDENAGRTVLLILTPRDLKQLFPLLATVGPAKQALQRAAVHLKRGQGVVVAVPRRVRGYLFVVAAPSPEKMKAAARAFFALEQIPEKDVVVP